GFRASPEVQADEVLTARRVASDGSLWGIRPGKETLRLLGSLCSRQPLRTRSLSSPLSPSRRLPRNLSQCSWHLEISWAASSAAFPSPAVNATGGVPSLSMLSSAVKRPAQLDLDLQNKAPTP